MGESARSVASQRQGENLCCQPSVGGYLALMRGNDKRWLGKCDHKPADIAGVISLSGQMLTHFTIRAERGMENTTIVVDVDAPLHNSGQA